MTYKCSIDLFIEYIRSYCSTVTVYDYKLNIDMFSRYIISVKGGFDFDVKKLTKNDFIGYIFFLRGRPIRNTSVRTYARSIKVYLRWLYYEGYIDDNITVNVRFPKADNRLVIPLSHARVKNIENGINNSYCASRNLLIFSLMLDCGLRRQEVVALNYNNIDMSAGYMRIIDSKNNKSRIVPLPQKTRDLVVNYSAERPSFCMYEGALILNNICTSRITNEAIENIFSRLKKYDKGVYPHLLRHTFGTSYMLGGGSLEYLRILLGHDDYVTTKGYVHLASQMGLIHYDIYRLDKCMFDVFKVYEP